MIHEPTTAELSAIEAAAAKIGEQRLLDSARFWILYNAANGAVHRRVPVYARDAAGRIKKTWRGNECLIEQQAWRKLPLRRRQFMERCFMVLDFDSRVVPYTMNPAQRMREVAILRQERAGVPVRQVDLKARQIGFTTDALLRVCEQALRHRRSKTLLVSQDDETAQEALDKVNVGVGEMQKQNGERWEIALDGDSGRHKKFASPMRSQIKIASAQKKHPGRGFTAKVVLGDECAMWEDASKKSKALFNALPMRPDTFGLVFSTANGAHGFFYDLFKRAWRQRRTTIKKRDFPWNANFFPWFCDPRYRWTKTYGLAHGGKLPPEVIDELEKTLTDHERWLLEQTYLQRWSPSDSWIREEWTRADGSIGFKWRRVGVGWRNVDYDQLLWRRAKLEEHQGDPQRPETWYDFMSEYPATPDEAFVATGRLVFDQSKLKEMLAQCTPPAWRGDIMLAGDVEKAVRLAPIHALTDDEEELSSMRPKERKYDVNAIDAMTKKDDKNGKLHKLLAEARERARGLESG